ncbi:MAG: hypothetical protein ACLQDF_00995 [Desulfomonilia bacterium]
MKKVMTLVLILLSPFSLCAMRLLSESDLSNVNNPFSLSINPNQTTGINKSARAGDDSGGISNYLLNSIDLTNNYDVLYENRGETLEPRETRNLFFSLSLLWGNGMFNNLQFFLIDPATGKSYTTIIFGEDTQTTYSNPQAESTHTMAYPIDYTISLNNPYRYIIMDGTIEMRDTYRSPTTTIINAGSWVDIKTH